MIDVKEAVDRAAAFAENVLGKERTAGLQLEEVEFGKYEGVRDAWQITLSMLRPNKFGPALLGNEIRDYKVFTVSRDTGEVLSMKIRELAGVE